MFINSLYLVFASHIAKIGENPELLPITYQSMLIVHVVIGLAFFLLTIAFVILHLNKILRFKKNLMRVSGILLITTLIALFVSGLFILTEANSRENAWIFILHQAGAAIVVIVYLVHRFFSSDPPMLKKVATGLLATAVISSVIWSVHFIETQRINIDVHSAQGNEDSKNTSSTSEEGENDQYNDVVKIMEKYVPFTAPGDPDADSPFFPSKTTTSTGGFLPSRILTHDDLPNLQEFRKETNEKGFAPSYYLGAQSCERCHTDIVQQWSTSAHRFSSFNNPFYRKSVELTRDDIGNKASQFCGGCHDPAVMMAGNMLKHIDPLTPESQAGLTCLSCHAIDKIHDLTGNGNYNIQDKTESPYMFDHSKSGAKQFVHDYLLKAKPTVHKQRMLKPVFQKSEFCMTCHKVNLDKPVNNYRWLRGQNEYDAWQNSGVALNQPMTWYEPKNVRQCQGCHMPLEEAVLNDVAAKKGKVRSHRFLSVNTALPALRGDVDTIRRMEEFMSDDKLSIDIFAVHREDGKISMGLESEKIEFYPGEIVQFDVVVRNKNVGHTFPGGTNDSNQGWVDFEVKTDDTNVYRSGAIDDDYFVDPSAHFYQAVIVDKDGHRIKKRNAADIHTVVYSNVIRPSTSDVARYRFRIPEQAAGKKIQISSKLMWRKFNQAFTNFVFEDEKKPIPVMPVSTIENDQLSFYVKNTKAIVENNKNTNIDNNAESWMRYNDFGIGSFLDNDTKSAIMAFNFVTKLQPEKMDGWLNLARTYIKEGNLDLADEMLRKATELEPNQPRIAFFWGMLLEKNGRLDEAIKAYKRTLQTYPNNRNTWIRLGRVYWLDKKIPESIEAYAEVLRIDPENAQAYHQLSLAYNLLAADETIAQIKDEYKNAAIEFEKGFEKYKIDENASAITHTYRQKHPEDNKMSQKLIIHEQAKL